MKFYRNDEVEQVAEARLMELERVLGEPLRPPIPIDVLAENVLELDLLWDEIEELPGEVVLAGLLPRERLIVLNERRRLLFGSKPGLERSTKGHEMGHWDLFVDRAMLEQPGFPVIEQGGRHLFRSSPVGRVHVLNALIRDPVGIDLLRGMTSRADPPHEARAVNRYAAAIAMPRALLRAEALRIRRTHWPDLYRLAERFVVTISALCVRLEQLDLLYVDEQRRPFESKAAAAGQRMLW